MLRKFKYFFMSHQQNAGQNRNTKIAKRVLENLEKLHSIWD